MTRLPRVLRSLCHGLLAGAGWVTVAQAASPSPGCTLVTPAGLSVRFDNLQPDDRTTAFVRELSFGSKGNGNGVAHAYGKCGGVAQALWIQGAGPPAHQRPLEMRGPAGATLRYVAEIIDRGDTAVLRLTLPPGAAADLRPGEYGGQVLLVFLP